MRKFVNIKINIGYSAVKITIFNQDEYDAIDDDGEAEGGIEETEDEILDRLDRALVALRQACVAVLDGNANAWRFVDSGGREVSFLAEIAVAAGVPVSTLEPIVGVAKIAQLNAPVELGDRLDQLRDLIEKITGALKLMWE